MLKWSCPDLLSLVLRTRRDRAGANKRAVSRPGKWGAERTTRERSEWSGQSVDRTRASATFAGSSQGWREGDQDSLNSWTIRNVDRDVRAASQSRHGNGR